MGLPIYSVQKGDMQEEEYQRLLKKMGNNIYAIDESKFYFKKDK